MTKPLETRLEELERAACADATPEVLTLVPVIGRPDGTLHDPATGRTWTPGADEIVLRPATVVLTP